MKKIAIIDCRADDKTVYALEKLNITVIPTLKIDGLYDAVATHADIQIHYVGNNCFISAPQTYEYYKNYMPQECTLIKGQKSIGSKYPYDVWYNAAVLKDYVICNATYTDKTVLDKHNKEIINVKQGYSKCNICVVGDNAIITSDSGIAKAVTQSGVDVLPISQGHIELRNFDYGFIGGATGLIDNHILAVNGDINYHPDNEQIKKFCSDRNIDIVPLKDGNLVDIGTIIVNI